VSLSIFAVHGVGEITPSSNLVTEFLDALERQGDAVRDGDLIAVTSKIVAKAEGRVVPCGDTEADKIALVEREATRILRRRGPLRITETLHGFICANAGIDLSNTDAGTAVLLPVDPDRSARRFRSDLARRRDVDVAVIVTDTFGRVWRQGVTDVAIGSAGVRPVLDLRGTTDANGRILEATEVAIVDEIAGAVNLVLGKAAATPFGVVRGLDPSFFGDGSIRENVVRAPHEDLFR
jgi:coenzyme F420-0:L-glutamate ligase / coenzyme F420-1:gamma-L-glutamate ligase